MESLTIKEYFKTMIKELTSFNLSRFLTYLIFSIPFTIYKLIK